MKTMMETKQEHDEFFDKLPENSSQPGIFELIKLESLRKMGKVSKEATIQKALISAVFIRDSEIPMPKYDPNTNEEMPPAPCVVKEEGVISESCPSNQPYCRFGCVCESVNCQDMYDEHYEKHCRDTGDPECTFGCICDNAGPQSGESKWISSKPYKYKKPRVRDDEDCGFIPLHMREQTKEGRPKRKAQAPTRYRPDFSISEKELRAYENGNGGNTNGVSKKTSSRPRRRLCEDEDDDGSDDSDERIISDKKKKTVTPKQYDPDSPFPKKGRPAKLPEARNLREPSKRERRPRNFDIPEPEPRAKRQKTNNNSTPSSPPTKLKVACKEKVVENEELSLGSKLQLVNIQSASKTCQGMFAVVRVNSEITNFVSWDEGSNTRPYVQNLSYHLTSSRPNQSFVELEHDVLLLPYLKTEDTMWLFYSVKKNVGNWEALISPELHSMIQSDLLRETIEKFRQKAILAKESRIMDASHLNINRRDEQRYRSRFLYLFFAKNGDVYWFGTPPPIYIEKNFRNAGSILNALIRPRQLRNVTTRRAARPHQMPKLKVRTLEMERPPVPSSFPLPLGNSTDSSLLNTNHIPETNSNKGLHLKWNEVVEEKMKDPNAM